ncbi:MAG: polysulfide reductase NrfD [Deltaproteobacteria bacterium]|jgi:molybdopterin-containing oxidoreductase family membrane subunit|nr:polysulfide reductase NrfD [Deltaproteobacteria bacterium]
MAANIEDLEEGRLASTSVKWITHLFSLFVIAGMTAGVYATMAGHHIAYGISREIPWGILTSSFAFFAISSTGLCLIAAISHAYGVTPLRPLGTRAVYLAIVTTVTAFMLLVFSVESPWLFIYYNAASPSLTSNLWWLSTLYGIMAGGMFLRFAFLVSGSQGLALTFGIIAAVTGVGANNNLGGLFTLAADPAIWFGIQLLVLFLASAVLSGTAAIIIFTVLAYKLRKQSIVGETHKALETAATLQALMIGIVLVVTIARFYSMFFSDTPDPGIVAARALINGPLAVNFWGFEIFTGLLLPLTLLLISKTRSVWVMTLASCMALVGGYVQRFDLIYGGQIVPKFSGWNELPQYFHYFPSGAELIVVIGAFSLVGFGFLMGERFVGKLFRIY